MSTETKANRKTGKADGIGVVMLERCTVIDGSDFIPKKLIGIIDKMLDQDTYNDNFGISTVRFLTNGRPKDMMGKAYPDAGAIAINLKKIWDTSVGIVRKGEKRLSLLAVCWLNLLTTIGHEIAHMNALRDPETRELLDTADEEIIKGMDAEADDWAIKELIRLAKKYDIEPGGLEEISVFATSLMELATDAEVMKSEWLAKTTKHLEDGVIYEDTDNKIVLKSFRDYVKAAYAKEGDTDWEQGVVDIELVFEDEKGEMVGEMKTEETTEEPIAETAVATAENANACQTQTIFVTESGQAEVAAATSGVNGVQDATAQTEQPVFANTQLELPDHIKQQQEQFAAAAATAGPAAQTPPATQYPPNELDLETMVNTMEQVYRTLHHAIYTKCGWGPQASGGYGFANPGGILSSTNVAQIIEHFGANRLIMSYDTLNANGQLVAEEFQGQIRGRLFSNGTLPGFDIYLNVNGMRIARRVIAQNPNKPGSRKAAEAQMGNAITWVINNKGDLMTGEKKFLIEMNNNSFTVL